MMPDQGTRPVDVSATLESNGEMTVGDRTIPTTIWAVRFSHMPGITSKQTLSSDGVLVRDEIDVPFGTMVTRIVDRDVQMLQRPDVVAAPARHLGQTLERFGQSGIELQGFVE